MEICKGDRRYYHNRDGEERYGIIINLCCPLQPVKKKNNTYPVQPVPCRPALNRSSVPSGPDAIVDRALVALCGTGGPPETPRYASYRQDRVP